MPICSHTKVPKVVLCVGRRWALLLPKDFPARHTICDFKVLRLTGVQRQKILVFMNRDERSGDADYYRRGRYFKWSPPVTLGVLFVEAHTEGSL